MERQLEALSNGHDTLREEMVLQENELSALRAALDDAHTLREEEAKRVISESLRANVALVRANARLAAEVAAAYAAGRRS
jgi:pseudouridine-5'-phosphate glycosidase